MGHVGRIGDLQARDGVLRVGWAEAEEADEHHSPGVRAPLQVVHLGDAFVARHLVQLGIEGHVVGHQILCHFLLSGLIVVAVEVYRVTFDCQREFFGVVQRKLTAERGVFVGIVADKNTLGLAELDRCGDELDRLVVVDCSQLLEAAVVHLASKEFFLFRIHPVFPPRHGPEFSRRLIAILDLAPGRRPAGGAPWRSAEPPFMSVWADLCK